MELITKGEIIVIDIATVIKDTPGVAGGEHRTLTMSTGLILHPTKAPRTNTARSTALHDRGENSEKDQSIHK